MRGILLFVAIVGFVVFQTFPVFGEDFVLSPDPNNPHRTQDIPFQWQPDISISFSGAVYSGYQYVGLESKTSVGTWSEDTWHPPLEAKTVTEICVGKWVPIGGEGGEGQPPPILYSHAMNKGIFPDKMEFIKPTIDTYICSGESVPLELQVWDQNGQLISGYTIEWTINQTGTYFSISGDSGYTATLTSADNTPGGESCTVTAKIKDTDITATSKKIEIAVFEVKAREVNVPDPLAAEVKYQVVPGSVTLDSATFIAPGTTQVKTNVSGNFNFTFDQTKLSGQQVITLTVTKGTTSCSIDIQTSRVRKVTPTSAEILIARFFVEGVGTRLYTHSLWEMYHEVTYSIPFSGKTIWVGESTALLYEGKFDYGKLTWTEQHKYKYGGGSTSYQGMSPPAGPIIISEYTEARGSSADLWPPTQALKGIAKCTGLIYNYDGGIAWGLIGNASVDRSIP